MNKRLIEIIRYKTGGKQIQFAELMGWSPQYLAKLVKGENFGLQPVLSLLSAFPEISARWFLFGDGQMLEVGRLFDLQRQTLSHVLSLLDLEKFIPVMTGEEIREFEEAIKTGRKPSYNPDTLSDMTRRLIDRTENLNAKFAQATAKSDELCKQKTAKK
jgi:transcriptional regulator with XRE-family HTH domain